MLLLVSNQVKQPLSQIHSLLRFTVLVTIFDTLCNRNWICIQKTIHCQKETGDFQTICRQVSGFVFLSRASVTDLLFALFYRACNYLWVLPVCFQSASSPIICWKVCGFVFLSKAIVTDSLFDLFYRACHYLWHFVQQALII